MQVASDAIASTQARQEFKKIIRYHQSHKADFGFVSVPEIQAKISHAYQKLSTVQEKCDKEKLSAHVVQLSCRVSGRNGAVLLRCIYLENLF